MEIRRAVFEDVDTIERIMQEAMEATDNKDWYVTDDRDFIEAHVSGSGFALMAEEDGASYGFLIVHIPGQSMDNMGNFLTLDNSQLNQVAYMDSVAVLPSARGRGIQKQLIMEAESILNEVGYHYLMATVHPDNIFSHGNFTRQGYRDVMTGEMYGGRIRTVVCKEI